MEVNQFHAWNDTVFLRGRDIHGGVYHDFFLVSYNGGKNWDSATYPKINPSGGYFWGFYPNDGRYWVLYQDSITRFYTSRDGKNFDSIVIGKDTSEGMGGITGVYIDPLDATHIIFKGKFSEVNISFEQLFQSFDGGRNWQYVDVPIVPNERIYLDVAFNIRRSGVWYAHVTEKAHHTEPDKDTIYTVRTTDNGETFEGGQPWAAQYGIGDSEEVRNWWGSSDQIINGTVIWQEIDSNRHYIDWLKMFHNDLPLSNPANGYYRGLTQYYQPFSNDYIYYPSNYLFFQRNPYISTIVEGEIKVDITADTIKHVSSWIYQTTDNWKTWNKIWESGPHESAERTFLDQGNNSLWTVTKFPYYGNWGNRYKSYLYKYHLILSIVKNNRYSEDLLKAFPSPAREIIKIRLPASAENVVALSLFDLLGRCITKHITDFFFNQSTLEWNIPNEVLSGCYVLKITTNNSIYSVKIILHR
jgi:hypothetical protein